jgi:hypothetical protein
MGKEKEDLGHLDGRASQFEAFSVFPAYDNDARKRVEWLVRAPEGGEITVIAGTARAGTVRASVTLSST